jgi:hypothetical protein
MPLSTSPGDSANALGTSIGFRRFAGILAIGGGIAGLSVTLAGFAGFAGVLAYVGLVVACCLYSFGVYAGVRTFEGDSAAPDLVERFFWLQVPILQTGLMSYFFATLGSLSLIYRGGVDFDFVVTLLGGWTFAISSVPPDTGVGVNLFPILVLIALKVLRRVDAARRQGLG